MTTSYLRFAETKPAVMMRKALDAYFPHAYGPDFAACFNIPYEDKNAVTTRNTFHYIVFAVFAPGGVDIDYAVDVAGKLGYPTVSVSSMGKLALTIAELNLMLPAFRNRADFSCLQGLMPAFIQAVRNHSGKARKGKAVEDCGWGNTTSATETTVEAPKAAPAYDYTHVTSEVDCEALAKEAARKAEVLAYVVSQGLDPNNAEHVALAADYLASRPAPEPTPEPTPEPVAEPTPEPVAVEGEFIKGQGKFALAVGYGTAKHGETVRRNLALSRGQVGNQARIDKCVALFGSDYGAVWSSGLIPAAWVEIYITNFKR